MAELVGTIAVEKASKEEALGEKIAAQEETKQVREELEAVRGTSKEVKTKLRSTAHKLQLTATSMMVGHGRRATPMIIYKHIIYKQPVIGKYEGLT